MAKKRSKKKKPQKSGQIRRYRTKYGQVYELRLVSSSAGTTRRGGKGQQLAFAGT